jgi:hypothetical protein
MSFYKKRSKQFILIAMLVASVLLVYLLLTPFLYNQGGEALNQRKLSAGVSDQRLQIRQERNISFLLPWATENEYAIDMASYHMMSKSGQVNRQLPNPVTYSFAMLLITCGIIIRKSRYHVGKADSRSSVLAKSLGGHAPPVLYYS